MFNERRLTDIIHYSAALLATLPLHVYTILAHTLHLNNISIGIGQ